MPLCRRVVDVGAQLANQGGIEQGIGMAIQPAVRGDGLADGVLPLVLDGVNLSCQDGQVEQGVAGFVCGQSVEDQAAIAVMEGAAAGGADAAHGSNDR